MECQTRYSFDFGSRWTPLVKKFLMVYGTIYLIEIVLQAWIGVPVFAYLSLHAPDMHFWQFVTHPFSHAGYHPISFLLACLMFYFFAPTIESEFGTIRFLFFFYFSALGGMLCGLLFNSVPGFNAPLFGMMPSILSMIVVFGFMHANSTIHLFFVLPIRAVYIAYLTIIIEFLAILAKADPHAAYNMGGILFGYLFYKKLMNVFDFNLLYLKYLQWQYERQRRRRFKVFEGGKDKDDGPTFH